MRKFNFIFVCAFFLFPLQLWAYGAIKVNHSGAPLKHQNPTALTWNPDHGPIMTDEAAHPFRALADVDALCGGHAARASDAVAGGGGGGEGGGGGCSMNPFIREAWAQTVDPISFTNDAWAQWNNVTEANVHVSQGSFLEDGDVTVCNADRYVEILTNYSGLTDPRICGCISPRPEGCSSTTCTNPVLFDPNGDILVARYDGDESIRTTLLAEAGPDFYFTNPANQEGYAIRFTAIINGACLVGSALPACTRTYTAEQLKGVLTHELGHALGLDHSQTNKAAVAFNSADGTYNLVGGNPEAVPTMYPFLVRGANQATLHRDDKMGLAHLYPKSDFARNTCRAEGIVYNNARTGTGLACGEVVLRDTVDPTNEALSFISGAEVSNNYDAHPDASGCQASGTGCGNFVVEGLLPRHSYTVELRTVASGISGSSSMINPCMTPRSDFSEIAPSLGTTIYCGAGGAVIQCSSAAPGSPLCVQGRTR